AREHATRVCPVDAGLRYQLRAAGTWKDWFITTDALGYPSTLIQRPFERRRLVPDANWFALCGVLAPPKADADEVLQVVRSQAFDLSTFIASCAAWTPAQSAILYVFPNDLYSAYWNNSGAIEVTVESELG